MSCDQDQFVSPDWSVLACWLHQCLPCFLVNAIFSGCFPAMSWVPCVDQPRLDQAVPFSTTPTHRIMVPSGDDATVRAIDLKLGSWVMCSDGMAKKVIGMKLIPAARLH